MNIQVKVKTPPGQASKVATNPMFKMFVLGKLKKYNAKHIVSEKDDEFTWNLKNVDVHTMMKINRNISSFSSIGQVLLDKKMIKKAAKLQGYTPEQIEEVKQMFSETSVEIIKET